MIQIQIGRAGPLQPDRYLLNVCIDPVENGSFNYVTNSFKGTREEVEAEASRLLDVFASASASIERFL